MRENLRGNPLAALQVPFFLAAQTRAIRAAVVKRDIGIVNSHWLVPQGLAAAWARGRGRFYHVLHVHAADVFLLEKLPWGSAVARYVTARTDAIFADGSGVRDVGGHRQALRPGAVNGFAGLFQRARLDVRRHDFHSPAREIESKRQPDSARGTGHDRRFSFKFLHGTPFCFFVGQTP